MLHKTSDAKLKLKITDSVGVEASARLGITPTSKYAKNPTSWRNNFVAVLWPGYPLKK